MQKKRLRNVLSAALVLAAYYGFVKSTGTGIPCLFRYFFRLKCPGCGVTHMLLYMTAGKVRQAFFSHPVIFCFSPFLTWILGKSLWNYVRGIGSVWKKWETAGMLLFLALLMVFFVVRNMDPAVG